ncbi:hypothetical protein MJO00_13215, partial [Salmonella enterica subsp. enterica serovar Cerro]|nr:hypothetical protein [Salmonella enterica subsp. enterica serovar Cerro]
MDTKKIFKHIPWVILGIIGAFCLSVVALRRGEHVSALWIVVASVSVYLVAYRYYSLYIAQKVMKLDPTRATPAVINNDGLNYVPTNRYVLFGHHFAAIAGAGPLVGPVLAAQMGYLPGTLWLLAGVVLAGGEGCTTAGASLLVVGAVLSLLSHPASASMIMQAT